jgi:hypothetical protein
MLMIAAEIMGIPDISGMRCGSIQVLNPSDLLTDLTY